MTAPRLRFGRDQRKSEALAVVRVACDQHVPYACARGGALGNAHDASVEHGHRRLVDVLDADQDRRFHRSWRKRVGFHHRHLDQVRTCSLIVQHGLGNLDLAVRCDLEQTPGRVDKTVS